MLINNAVRTKFLTSKLLAKLNLKKDRNKQNSGFNDESRLAKRKRHKEQPVIITNTNIKYILW